MANIALIIGGSPSSSRDVPIYDLLINAGHTVTYIDDSDTPAIGSYDMLVISESVSASNGRDWHELDIPIITTEPALYDQGYGTGNSTSSAGDETAKVNAADYITDDYSINDEFEYCDSGDDRGYITGWANDVKALLLIANDAARALMLSIEDGATDANDDTTTNRRVMFAHARAGEWTTDGEDIFLRGIDWCLGLDASGNNYTENLSAGSSAAGSVNNTVSMQETISNTSTSYPDISNTLSMQEILSGLTNSTPIISNIVSMQENLTGAMSSAGNFAGNVQIQEALSAASSVVGALSAGISYLSALSGSSASVGTMADIKTFIENLVSESASAGSLSIISGLVENLQAITQSVFSVVHTQASTEILNGTAAALATIQEHINGQITPNSRQTFHRKYNLSFVSSRDLSFQKSHDLSFAHTRKYTFNHSRNRGFAA